MFVSGTLDDVASSNQRKKVCPIHYYFLLVSYISTLSGAYLSEQQHHLSMMCQDSSAGESKSQSEERKSKKRKSDSDPWSATPKKGKPGMSELMDSDSESDNSDGYVNEDDNTMNSNSTNEDVEGRESSVSQNEFASDLELSGMDATDALGAQDNRTSSDMDNSNDGEVEDMIRCVPLVITHPTVLSTNIVT